MEGAQNRRIAGAVPALFLAGVEQKPGEPNHFAPRSEIIMPTINDLKQSRFLTKGDVGRGMLLTIKGWHEENVAMSGEAEANKYCLDFEETDKPLVLNSTKGQIIAKICGAEDFDGWVGYRIVAYHDPNVSMAGRVVGGIAVRAPKIAPTPTPVPPAPRPATAKAAPARPVPATAEEAEAPIEGDDVPF
jgi:hypothetical protein